MISKIAKIKNEYLKYTMYRLYEMKSRLIIILICGVLSFPLISTAIVLYENMDAANPDREGFEFFLLISVLLTILSGIIVTMLAYTGGMSNYDYYNKREAVDKSWSLPLTNKQRFWGDFTAGLAPIVIMYIISAGIGLLIFTTGMNDEWMENAVFIVEVISSSIFTGLLTLITLYIVGVFIASICGRVFEAVVYPFLICGIIPALITLLGLMIFMDIWQVQIYEQLSTVLASTSPFGFFGVFINELFSNYSSRMTSVTEHIIFLKPAIIIPFVLVHGGILTAAYYLAKKRKAECTGKPFVFKLAPELIISFVVFCITAVFCYALAHDVRLTPGVMFGMFTCTAIAFLILDVSAKRGFKKMGTAFFRYAAMFVGSIVVSNILLITNGFGAGSYVPAQDRVRSVSINAVYLDSIEIFHGWGNVPDTHFTDTEAVELIRRLHRESNENPYNDEINTFQGARSWYQKQLTYTLNNGRTVKRFVRLDGEQIENMLPLIMETDYKQTNLNLIENFVYGRDTIQTVAAVSSLSQERVSHGGGLTDSQRIYEAFKQDYLAETFEQRFNSTETVLGKLNLTFNEPYMRPDGRVLNITRLQARIYVFAHYENLIAELERQGFDVWNGASNRYFLPAKFTVMQSSYIGANIATERGVSWNWNFFERDDETSELLDMLLEVAQPSLSINGAGYFLVVAGSTGYWYYVIPPEYNRIAEELRLLTVIDDVYDEWGDETWYYTV